MRVRSLLADDLGESLGAAVAGHMFGSVGRLLLDARTTRRQITAASSQPLEGALTAGDCSERSFAVFFSFISTLDERLQRREHFILS